MHMAHMLMVLELQLLLLFFLSLHVLMSSDSCRRPSRDLQTGPGYPELEAESQTERRHMGIWLYI